MLGRGPARLRRCGALGLRPRCGAGRRHQCRLDALERRCDRVAQCRRRVSARRRFCRGGRAPGGQRSRRGLRRRPLLGRARPVPASLSGRRLRLPASAGPGRLLHPPAGDVPARRVFEAEGALDEALHYALDLEYWLRLGAAGRRFRHLPVALAALRLHAAAKSIRHLAAFAPEVVGIYERMAHGGSPMDPSLLRRVLSIAHYRASQCLFWSRRFSEARVHAWRSWRLAPLHVRPLLAALMGGAAARTVLERWRGNPFTAGVGPA